MKKWLIFILIVIPVLTFAEKNLFTAATNNDAEFINGFQGDVNMGDQYGRTALMLASGIGRLDAMKALMDQHADVNAKYKGYNDRTALMMAAVEGKTEAVKILIVAKADVNARETRSGETVLMLTAGSYDDNKVEIVKILIEAGADVGVQDEDGKTVLMKTADQSIPEPVLLKALINAHADVNTKNKTDGWTALMYASRNCSKEAVKELLSANADITMEDKHGNTALTIAANSGKADAVQVLIAAGAKVDAAVKEKFRILLFEAAEKDDTNAIKVWTTLGADINAVNKDSMTALMLAAQNGNTNALKALIEADADLNAKDKNYGDSALVFADEKNQQDAVRVLIAAGADVNTCDKQGTTVLMLSAQNSHPETVKALIAAGADVNAKTGDGFTALFSAVGKKNVMDVLIKNGADVNVTNDEGKTALMAAAAQVETNDIELLIGAGANPGVKDHKGLTARDYIGSGVQYPPADNDPVKIYIIKLLSQGKMKKDSNMDLYTITGDNIRVRSGSGTNSQVLLTLSRGAKVSLINRSNNAFSAGGKNGSWVYIDTGDPDGKGGTLKGWIVDVYLKK